MSNPPNAITITMTDADVQENLVHIVNSLDKIRTESIANVGATDDQKQDYLRLTGELASCIKASIDGNPILGRYYDAIKGLVKHDPVLMRYDPAQEEFWNDRDAQLKQLLTNAGMVFLKDDFRNENQGYHLLQAFKYLGVNGNRDEVYESILPLNSLLNEHSLSSPELSKFLLKKMFTTNGLGVEVNIDVDTVVKSLAEAGALYVDLPKEQYQSMKKKFPKTTMIEDGKEKFTRVIFAPKDVSSFNNISEKLKEYAQIDLGAVEETLVKNISEFYSYGKEFLDTLVKTIGLTETKSTSKKQVKTLDNKLFELDTAPAEGGQYKTQDQWIDYWNSLDGDKYMASTADLYSCFKNLKTTLKSGSAEEKVTAKALVDSLRKDFNDRWIITSTRIEYTILSPLEGRIIHHYKSKNPELTKEITLNIPVYRDVKLADVTSSEDGLKYLQAYWGTEDDANTITETMEFISGKKKGSIKVWTADTTSNNSATPRNVQPQRVAGLDYNDDYFHIVGDGYLSLNGRSRGGAYK